MQTSMTTKFCRISLIISTKGTGAEIIAAAVLC